MIGNGFLATLGLRVEPGEGVTYRSEVDRGSLLPPFHRAIEEAVPRALAQGNYGWPVTDVTVTLVQSGYWPRPYSTAAEFRNVTPHVLAQALAEAGTQVYEPYQAYEADVPSGDVAAVTGYLIRAGARVGTALDGRTTTRVIGEIPTRLVYDFQRALPGLSRGRGVWSARPAPDQPVRGEPPRRPRTDGNPADRVEYMRFLAQGLQLSRS